MAMAENSTSVSNDYLKRSPALEVKNAKHSSIRGNGEKRIILLDNLDDVKIQYIHQ